MMVNVSGAKVDIFQLTQICRATSVDAQQRKYERTYTQVYLVYGDGPL